MTYNYEVEVKKDLENYIDEHYDIKCDFENLDASEIFDKIYDDALMSDSVTGNASGSYTFCRYQAEENLLHNIDLVYNACIVNFGYDEAEVGKLYLNEDFETLDVIVRCYVVGKVLWDLIEEKFEF